METIEEVRKYVWDTCDSFLGNPVDTDYQRGYQEAFNQMKDLLDKQKGG